MDRALQQLSGAFFLFAVAGFFFADESIVEITFDATMIATAARFLQGDLIALKTEIDQAGITVLLEYGGVGRLHGHFSLQLAGTAAVVLFEVDEELVHIRLFGIPDRNVILLILHIIAAVFVFPG